MESEQVGWTNGRPHLLVDQVCYTTGRYLVDLDTHFSKELHSFINLLNPILFRDGNQSAPRNTHMLSANHELTNSRTQVQEHAAVRHH